MESDQFDDDVSSVAALDDPVRRTLYRYVAGQSDLVSRERAAAVVGISRSLAAFHLDKLVAAGLLAAEFHRPAGRSGPGAGRPAKLYRRSERQVDVTLPPRRYELAARILAAAVAEASAERRPIDDVLTDSARRLGAELATRARSRSGPRPSRRALIAAAVDVLRTHGYEPVGDGTSLVLSNCPFHALATEHTELVCGMNADVLGAFTGALPELDLDARLEPAEGRCCVTLAAPNPSSA